MTGVQSPVPEATQVLGARESGSAPSGSQEKPRGFGADRSKRVYGSFAKEAPRITGSQFRDCKDTDTLYLYRASMTLQAVRRLQA
jgi:hypothetical protein